MGSEGETVLAEAREVSRLREQLLSQQHRPLTRSAEMLAAAIREGRAVHLVGEDLCAPLAAYLAALFLRGDAQRVLPARPLEPAGRDVDALARSVQACVKKGDVVLALCTRVSPSLMRAISRTRLRGATSIALLSENSAHGLACDQALSVPTGKEQVAHELFLALGHALHAMLVAALTGLATSAEESSALEDVPVSEDSFADRVIDRDLDSADGRPLQSEEEALLSVAIDSLAPPPTSPGFVLRRGREREPASPPAASPPPLSAPPPAPAPPAQFRFRCGACEKVVTVEARQAGRRAHCPHCRVEYVIPQPRDVVPSPVPAAPPPVRDPSSTPPFGMRPIPPAAPQAGPASSRPQTVKLGMGTSPPGGAMAGAPLRGDPAQVPPTKDELRPPWGAGGAAPQKKAPVKERRRATRVTVRDAVLRVGKDDFPAVDRYEDGLALDDLSLTGLRFLGPSQDLKVGDLVHLLLDFPAYPEPVRVKGQVRRIEGTDLHTVVGVRFVQWVADAEVRVRRLIENVQLRSVRRR